MSKFVFAGPRVRYVSLLWEQPSMFFVGASTTIDASYQNYPVISTPSTMVPLPSAVQANYSVYDPLASERKWKQDWNEFSNPVVWEKEIDDGEIINKCWDKQEIIDWIEANCSSTVYCQRHEVINGWWLVFDTNDEKESFCKWWSTKERQGETVETKTLTQSMRQWLANNVVYYKISKRRFVLKAETGHHVCDEVLFRYAEDAVHFKLRWEATDEQDEEEI